MFGLLNWLCLRIKVKSVIILNSCDYIKLTISIYILFQFSENTFKHYYYPENIDASSDEEGTVGLKIKQAIAKKRPANNIDAFFERPKKKSKGFKKSSSVSQSSTDGVAFIASGRDDAAYASKLIKIEVYDLDKIKNIPPPDHWKHCDVRLKYYSSNSEEDSTVQSVQDVIFNITKQLASNENSVKYFIETDKKWLPI